MRTLVIERVPARILLTKVFGRVSRRAYFGPWAPLRFLSIPDPPLPAPDWVRVRNRMCGICGSDLHQIFLEAGLDVAPLALPATERIFPGHEMVGEVVEVGPDVTDVRPGDRVVRWGRGDDCRARGEEVLCPPCQRGHRVLCERASEPRDREPVGGGFGDSFIAPASTLVRVPDELPDEAAIFAEPAAVAIHAVWRRVPPAGERVCVIGCGTIGFLILQVLRIVAPQSDVTAVAEFPWQAELARALGAHHTFLARDDGMRRVAEITQARYYRGIRGNEMLIGGFDVVFDVVGIPATLHQALRWTRAGGTVVLVGVYLHRMHIDLTPVWYQEVDLIGAIGHDIVEWEGQPISTFDLAMRWMVEGRLNTAPLLTHRFPLDRYREALAVAADKRRYRSIKVALVMSDSKV